MTARTTPATAAIPAQRPTLGRFDLDAAEEAHAAWAAHVAAGRIGMPPPDTPPADSDRLATLERILAEARGARRWSA